MAAVFVATAVLVTLFSVPAVDSETEAELARTILIEGVYYEDEERAVVTYEDASGMTNSVVLEVLGMDVSFQRTYEASKFAEAIPFSSEPKYGWPVHPIVIVVDHARYGTVDAKTEIRAEGEPAPRVIYGVR